jgi:hypothetical protein
MNFKIGIAKALCQIATFLTFRQASHHFNVNILQNQKLLNNDFPPIGLGTIPTRIRPENPRELTGKMFRNSGFITSHFKKFLKILVCEVMNLEFWKIFPVSSRGFSGRISVGIVPSPVGPRFDSNKKQKIS